MGSVERDNWLYFGFDYGWCENNFGWRWNFM